MQDVGLVFKSKPLQSRKKIGTIRAEGAGEIVAKCKVLSKLKSIAKTY